MSRSHVGITLKDPVNQFLESNMIMIIDHMSRTFLGKGLTFYIICLHFDPLGFPSKITRVVFNEHLVIRLLVQNKLCKLLLNGP